MPGRPKSGPPYNDPPPGTYIVVVNPWGMTTISRERGQRDFDRVSAWVEFVLQQSANSTGNSARRPLPRVECVYGMGTRSEVIVQLPLNTDVTPLLGVHYWATIAREWSGSPSDSRSSSIFIYNWRNHGDPANHNWSDWYPRPGQVVPAKLPYPAPSWTSPPLTLGNFVIPIPRPPTPRPPPPSTTQPPLQDETIVKKEEDRHDVQVPMKPEPKKEEMLPSENGTTLGLTQANQTPDESLFRPYEQPPHFPSNAQALDRTHHSSQPAESGLRFKHDPYGVEEDAQDLLRSFKPDPEDVKPNILDIKQEPDSVKPEEGPESTSSEYQPSTALLEAFNSLTQGSGAIPPSPSNPRAALSNSYQPSSELVDAINSLVQGSSTPSPPSAASGPTLPDAQGLRVKREYMEGEVRGMYEHNATGGKKVKVE